MKMTDRKKAKPDKLKAQLAKMSSVAAAEKAAHKLAAVYEGHPPYEVLGRDGKQVMLYSRERKAIIRLSAERPSRDAIFILVCPADKLRTHFENGAGMTESELAAEVKKDIANKLGSRTYDPDKVRGAGIWNDPDGIIYSTGRDCYLLRNGESQPRPVYPMRPDGILYAAEVAKESLPAPAVQPLTNADGKAIYELLAARSWGENYAPDIVGGWMVAALLAGFLPLRPHIWINGERGNGKSALFADLRALYGESCHAFAGAETTPAGMRNVANGTVNWHPFFDTQSFTFSPWSH